jgi:hypothetical protein
MIVSIKDKEREGEIKPADPVKREPGLPELTGGCVMQSETQRGAKKACSR